MQISIKPTDNLLKYIRKSMFILLIDFESFVYAYCSVK